MNRGEKKKENKGMVLRTQYSPFRVFVVYTRSQSVNRFGCHVASFVFSFSGFRIVT